ncbi:MAG: hypothetical protein EOP83_35630 [Verrucomicrobiaceae bacterium]|nr:MAG: hypothetical protein EOP83_35630 [Verrucomicrobiaceae bacterium]
MKQHLDKAIGNLMHAMKIAKRDGTADQGELKRAMAYFNCARTMQSIGDDKMALTMINGSLEVLNGLQEGFLGFGGGKGKQTVGEVPSDRMVRATSSADTTAATRNKWMGSGKGREHRNPEMDGVPGRSAAKPPMTPSAPSKPAFGKRRP